MTTARLSSRHGWFPGVATPHVDDRVAIDVGGKPSPTVAELRRARRRTICRTAFEPADRVPSTRKRSLGLWHWIPRLFCIRSTARSAVPVRCPVYGPNIQLFTLAILSVAVIIF